MSDLEPVHGLERRRGRSPGCGISALPRILPIAICAAALGVLCLPLSCTRPSPKPNIIVILADAMRADALQVDSATTQPFLYGLARHSTLFTRAYANSSWTSPSIATLFTSRFASQHHDVHFGSILAEEEITLAECLKEGGYRTAGFTTNLLNAHPSYGQGFDEYQYVFLPAKDAKVRAPLVQQRLSKWLDKQPPELKTPIFLYLHYLESHIPYRPPLPVLQTIRSRRQPATAEAIDPQLRGVGPDGQEYDLRDLYAAEIADLDNSLAALFRMLDERGLLDNSVVVFLSDHGEEFLEHGRVGHGATLFEESLRIPLLVHVPGQAGSALVTHPVSIVDLAPSLLKLAGVPVPASFEGRSLEGELGTGAPAATRRLLAQVAEVSPWATNPFAYSELFPQSADAVPLPASHSRAVTQRRYKSVATADGEVSVYDLDEDATEHHALAPAAASDVAEFLRGYVPSVSNADHAGTVLELDEQTQERLRALGYVAK